MEGTTDADFNETGIYSLNTSVTNYFWHEIHKRFLLCLNEKKYMSKSHFKEGKYRCISQQDWNINFVAAVPKHFWLESLDINERFLLSLGGGIQEKYMLTTRSSINFNGLVVAQGQKGK